jgi:hypothetical protein
MSTYLVPLVVVYEIPDSKFLKIDRVSATGMAFGTGAPRTAYGRRGRAFSTSIAFSLSILYTKELAHLY